MLLSVDLRNAYLEVMAKAQAVQICGSKDPACPTSGIQDKLVSLYSAKMMHDETRVAELIPEIDKYLDGCLNKANPVTRTEVFKYLKEMREDTWMYQKLEDINSKLTYIIQGQEISDNATPVRSVTVEQKVKPVEKKKITEKKRAVEHKSLEDSESYKAVLKCVKNLAGDRTFSSADVAMLCKRDNVTSFSVGKILVRMEENGIVVMDHIRSKCKQYKKV